MIFIVHAPALLLLIALQFQVCAIDKPSPLRVQLRTAITIVAFAVALLFFYLDTWVGTRAAIAALIIAATGLAHQRNLHAATRWYRWLALVSWCLCILATCAMIGAIIMRRLFT